MPKPWRAEEYVPGFRIRPFEREPLQVFRQLPVVRRMHGGEDFRRDNPWGHAFDVRPAGSAKIQAKAPGSGMALEKERQRLQRDEIGPGLIELFDQIEWPVVDRMPAISVNFICRRTSTPSGSELISRPIACVVRPAAARTRQAAGQFQPR